MTKEVEDALVAFSAHQHRVFVRDLWLTEPHRTRSSGAERAVVACFLAMTTFGHEVPAPAWIGHKMELIEIAEELAGTSNIQMLIGSAGFEPSRFAASLDDAIHVLTQHVSLLKMKGQKHSPGPRINTFSENFPITGHRVGSWPRIRDLPTDEQAPFLSWLGNAPRPLFDDAAPQDQDGYFPWDWEEWYFGECGPWI